MFAPVTMPHWAWRALLLLYSAWAHYETNCATLLWMFCQTLCPPAALIACPSPCLTVSLLSDLLLGPSAVPSGHLQHGSTANNITVHVPKECR